MGKKKNKGTGNSLVYTTGTEGNSFFNQISLGGEEEKSETDFGARIRIHKDRKNRAGKTATLIKGLPLDEDELVTLCKKLKNKCGVGGAAKDGEIMIQGDQVKKVIDILIKEGYKDVKQSGG